MHQYRIKLSDLAEEDLENVGDYIAYFLLNPSAAENTVKGIRTQVNKLKRFPDRHELDEDSILAEMNVRKIYYKEYKIFYVVDYDTETVNILRILHMRVDSRAWLYRTFGITMHDGTEK
jgi:plasmid stabilization system protein ParE